MLSKALRVFAVAILVPAALATEATYRVMPPNAAIPTILNLWVSTIFMVLVCWALAILLERR